MKNYGTYKIHLTSEGFKILELNTRIRYAIVPAGIGLLLIKTDEPIEKTGLIDSGFFSLSDNISSLQGNCMFLQDQQMWILLRNNAQIDKNINLQKVKSYQPARKELKAKRNFKKAILQKKQI